jgi:hypothetical protein
MPPAFIDFMLAVSLLRVSVAIFYDSFTEATFAETSTLGRRGVTVSLKVKVDVSLLGLSSARVTLT